jgi:hypothetical protein
LAFGAAAIVATEAAVITASAQELAREGRGLLTATPEPAAGLLGTLGNPAGRFSQTIFETDGDPNFKLVIRDFSFPPDRQTHSVSLSSGAFLHVFGGQAEIRIAGQPAPLDAAGRTAVAPGAPIEVVNNGEQAFVVRALIVEAK